MASEGEYDIKSDGKWILAADGKWKIDGCCCLTPVDCPTGCDGDIEITVSGIAECSGCIDQQCTFLPVGYQFSNVSISGVNGTHTLTRDTAREDYLDTLGSRPCVWSVRAGSAALKLWLDDDCTEWDEDAYPPHPPQEVDFIPYFEVIIHPGIPLFYLYIWDNPSPVASGGSGRQYMLFKAGAAESGDNEHCAGNTPTLENGFAQNSGGGFGCCWYGGSTEITTGSGTVDFIEWSNE